MSNSAPVSRVRVTPQNISGLTHAAVSAYFESQRISINSTVRHATHFKIKFSRQIEPALVLGNHVINNINVIVTREPSGADNTPYSRPTGSSRSTLNRSRRSDPQQAQRQTGPNTPYANQQNLIPQRGLDVTRGAAQAQMSANLCMNPNSRIVGAQYMPMHQTRGNVFLNPAQIPPSHHHFTQAPSSQIISVPIRIQLNQASSQIISVPIRIQLTQVQHPQIISAQVQPPQARPPQIISAQVQPYQDNSSQPSQHPPPTHHQAIDVHGPSGASSTSLASGNAFLHISDQTQTSQVQRTQGQPQLTEIQPTQPRSPAHQQVDDDSGSSEVSPVDLTINKIHDESEASSKK